MRSFTQGRWLIIGESSELYTKSNQTRRRFRRLLDAALRDALAVRAPAAELVRQRRRLLVRAPDVAMLAAAADAAAHTFGVHRVSEAVALDPDPLDDLLAEVAERVRDRVAGRTFAVRIVKRGHQSWRTNDVAADLGARLLDASAGVNLDDPEVEVRVEIDGQSAWLIERSWPGPAGLPPGSQDRVAALLSGGFDSAVAAWMVASRGCPVDLVHFQLECAQTEHAIAVAHQLAGRWAAGQPIRLWVVDFQGVREALLDHVPADLRQVVLKQQMMAAADRLAERAGCTALVTGEAIGQVSSQTIANLAVIDPAATRPILRPLAGMAKQDIIARARRIGTHDLSVRAKEVCDLSDGPVSVAADPEHLAKATAPLGDDLVASALERLRVVDLAAWRPGAPAVPVATDGAAANAVRVDGPDGAEALPATGPLVLSGPAAVRVATEQAAAGRDVQVALDGRHAGEPVVAQRARE